MERKRKRKESVKRSAKRSGAEVSKMTQSVAKRSKLWGWERGWESKAGRSKTKQTGRGEARAVQGRNGKWKMGEEMSHSHTENKLLRRREHVEGERDFVLVAFEAEPAEEGGGVEHGE